VIRFIVRESLAAVVLVPLALAGDLVFGVPCLLTDIGARRHESVELKATIKAVGGAIIYPVWAVLLALAAGLAFGARAGVVALLLLPPFGLATLLARERERAIAGIAFRFLAARRTPRPIRHRLARWRDEIADVLDETHRWLEERRQPTPDDAPLGTPASPERAPTRRE
jgi:hypothetical protein